MTRQERKDAWMQAQNEKAVPQFMDKVAEIQARLAEMSAYFDDHMGYAPEDINFGHVGTAGYYLAQLTELTDNIFKRGEYAE
jgi:hypothetical protein